LFAQLFWRKGAWDITASANYISGYESNNTNPFFDRSTRVSSFTTVNLRVDYTFTRGLGRNWGEGARLQVGVGNIADQPPPFANTVGGYNQSLPSPLGRTYDVRLRLPLKKIARFRPPPACTDAFAPRADRWVADDLAIIPWRLALPASEPGRTNSGRRSQRDRSARFSSRDPLRPRAGAQLPLPPPL